MSSKFHYFCNKMDPIEFINSGQVISDKLISENPFNVFFWILIVFNLLSIAIAKAAHRNYLKTLFSTSVLNRYLMQNVQEDLKLKSFGSFLLTLSYFNSFAIIVSFLAGEPIGLFTMKILAILIVGILLKLALMKSISFISITRIGREEHYLREIRRLKKRILFLSFSILSSGKFNSYNIVTLIVFHSHSPCLYSTDNSLVYNHDAHNHS